MMIVNLLFLIHYFIGAALCFAIWVMPIADKWKAIILFYFILAIPMFAWLANKYT